MSVRALVFDLDGLLVDTESADYAAWARAWRDWGHELPRDAWVARIGSDGRGFDPLASLAERVGAAFDAEAMQAARRAHRDALLRELDRPLPGVLELLAAADELGLRSAVASSSDRAWVEARLAHAGLAGRFEALRCADDVPRVKPDPDLYLSALAALDAEPTRAIAFEDSPNGVAAARAAGLFCVAVPGPMTRGLDFAHAHLVLTSLAEVRLEELLERVTR